MATLSGISSTGTLNAPGVGSGLDVKTLVSNLMAVEQQPLTKLTSQEAKYQAKLSSLGSISGALSSLQVAAKALAHFLLSGLPLVLMAPVLGLQFGLESRSLGILMLTLLLGTPTLSLIGSIGAALTLGVRGAGVLLSLLILPLYIPVLIFGAGAVEADAAGLGVSGHLSLLAALLVLSVFFAPLATKTALRISLE